MFYSFFVICKKPRVLKNKNKKILNLEHERTSGESSLNPPYFIR